MKGRIAVSMVALATIALLFGCAGAPKVKAPKVEKAPTVGPLAELRVRVLAPNEVGELDMTTLRGKLIRNVGGFVMFGAKGKDAKGNEFWVDATWRAEPEGYVKIEPAIGPKVKVTGLKPSAKDEVIELIVEYGGLKATGFVEGIGE